MQEFKINDYISVKLKDGEVNIYVKGKRTYIRCCLIVIEYGRDTTYYNNFTSIDDIADNLYSISGWNSYRKKKIFTPEELFWGICSNLQVWVEHNYDTRLLHQSVSFSLLRELIKAGDPLAEEVYKKEIIKRIKEGNLNVVHNLFFDVSHFKMLNREDLKELGFPSLENLTPDGLIYKIEELMKTIISDKIILYLITIYLDSLLENFKVKDEVYDNDEFFDEVPFYIIYPHLRNNIINIFREVLRKGGLYVLDKVWNSDTLDIYCSGHFDHTPDVYELLIDSNTNLLEYFIRNWDKQYVDYYIRKSKDFKFRLKKLLLKNHNNQKFLDGFLRLNLYEHFSFEELESIFSDEKLGIFLKVIQYLLKIYVQTSYKTFITISDYFSKISDFAHEKFKNRILHLLRLEDLNIFEVLLFLRFFECFNEDELRVILDNPKYDFLKKLKIAFIEIVKRKIYLQFFFSQTSNLLLTLNKLIDQNLINKLYKELPLEQKENLIKEINIYVGNPKIKEDLKNKIIEIKKLITITSEFEYVIIKNEKFYVNDDKLQILCSDPIKISEIQGLNKLTKLQELEISAGILTIEGLEKLRNLKRLTLSKNQIFEIKGLDKLNKLEELDLRSNNIYEIKGIANLKKLKILKLDNNEIQKIKGINTLTQLEELHIDNNKIIEIEGVEKLKKLRWLSFGHSRGAFRGLAGLGIFKNEDCEFFIKFMGHFKSISLVLAKNLSDKFDKFHYDSYPEKYMREIKLKLKNPKLTTGELIELLKRYPPHYRPSHKI